MTYVGQESVEPQPYENAAFADQRAHRRNLEKFHGTAASLNTAQTKETNAFLQSAVADVQSGDRFLKTASRNAFFNSHVLWQSLDGRIVQQADFSNAGPDMVLAVAVAMARAPMSQIIQARELSEESAREWKQASQVTMVVGTAGLS